MASRSAGLPRELRALYVGTVATRLGTFVVPYLTLLSQERGLRLSTTGWVIAAGGAGLLVGNVVGGWLTDHVGRKPTLLSALGVNAIGITALAFALPSAGAYALILGFALGGAGMYTPAANAWIADLTTESQRARAYTVNYICINVGMGLGPLLGGVLAGFSFMWLFAGEVMTTLICAALIASVKPLPGSVAPSGRRTPQASPRARAGSETPHPWDHASLPVLAFCVASFFIIAPLMGLEYVVPLLVGTVLREPLVYVGLVYSINAACILALSLPVARLVRGAPPPLMMAGAGALWALGLTILAQGLSVWALLASTVVWSLGEIIASVVLPTYVSLHVAAAARGRFLALPDAMRSLAGIVAPIGLGVAWEAKGVGAVLLILVVTPAIGAVLYLGASLHRHIGHQREVAT